MARPAHAERNKDLVLKRISDPKKWSYRALGKHFRINERHVFDIVKRDVEVYSSAEQMKEYKRMLRLSTATRRPVR